MKRSKEPNDEQWFAKLDAIVTGTETRMHEDDDLLHVAAKLAKALSPLNEADVIGEQSLYLTRANPQRQQNIGLPIKRRKRLLLHPLLIASVGLFVFLGIAGFYSINTQDILTKQNIGQQIWQASTSFEQIDASSVALLTAKKAGVHPLLPTTVPAETQSVEFGIITDDLNPQAFRAFIADYRITGQDVAIYEQVTDLVAQSSAAQNISVGSSNGHLFQDNAGNSILQWYQAGMTCQIASTLPLEELLALARQFHPITRWELII